MNILERYRQLPDAGLDAPGWVWQWHKAEEEISATMAALMRQRDEARDRALEGLRQHWNDDELRAAGLLPPGE